MRSIFQYIILSLLISTPICLVGQDFESDIQQMKNAYQGIENYSLVVSYKLFKSHSDRSVYENTQATIMRNGSQFYYKIFGLESVVNKSYVIIVDNDSKLFMIDRINATAKSGHIENWMLPDSLTNQLMSFLEDRGKPIRDVEYSKISDTESGYIINYNYGELVKQAIFFNPTDYKISRIVHYYRHPQPIDEARPDKPRLEINYNKFIANPQFETDQFSEKKYATIKEKKSIQLKSKYRDYQIINHLWLPQEITQQNQN